MAGPKTEGETMPLSPQEISHREFFTVKKGYDKDEVKAFLGVLARDQRILLDQIESLRNETAGLYEVGSHVSNVLQNAGAIAERLTRESEAKAAETRRRAEEEADLLRKATTDSTNRLKEEAEQYAYDVRTAAERAAREQQTQTADRVGRLLAGESSVRERLYSLEITLQGMRGELKDAAEGVYPQLSKTPPPLPGKSPKSLETETPGDVSVIDLRDGRSVTTNGAKRS